MESTRTIFGRRLRIVRKSRGLTLEELGAVAKIGFKHISQIERGSKVPSFEAIDRLSKALNVQPFELFLQDDAMTADADRELRRLIATIDKKGRPAIRRYLLAMLAWAHQLEMQFESQG